MNPKQDLPLRDIHLPDAVSWWPLAPGWWVSLILVIVLAVGLYLLIKRITKPVIKKSAKAELQHLMDDYAEHRSAQKLLQQLSVLMRRIGISYLPRSEAAGITGKDWYEQLNALVKGEPLSTDSIELLVSAPYRPAVDIPSQQVEQLLKEVRQWVSALSREASRD
jgi:hypothetical protein